ncbi:MAG: RNA ligase [Nitrosopumilaceae archaeon]|nr:RNA ligase [Nitrosopumilaceae archaeon]
MILDENNILHYVDRGLVNKNVNGEFTLYCYSKETFFSGEWNYVTKQCRGLVFHDGVQVNHPFPKIFNLNEVPETSYERVLELIETGHDYELLHKSNGHLTIVDYIGHLDKFLIHTKGSLQPNEMNEYDKELFFNRCSKMVSHIQSLRNDYGKAPSYTFLFESINPTDKHTLYDDDAKRYGENTLVLLGGYIKYKKYNLEETWNALDLWTLKSWARFAGIPVVDSYSNIDLSNKETVDALFKEENTEGYVIWFPGLDFRVKIKTDEYWKMRFLKELTSETIIDRFVKGGNSRLWSRYPEEIASKVVELLMEQFGSFIFDFAEVLSQETQWMSNKDVGLSEVYSKTEKSLIFQQRNGKINDIEGLASKNSGIRELFGTFMKDNHHLLTQLHDDLITYIEERNNNG